MPQGSAVRSDREKPATLAQAHAVLQLISEQGLDGDVLQRLLESGLLSDLLSVDPTVVSREGLQIALGLKSKRQDLKHLPYDPENPGPFKQPFLVLTLASPGGDPVRWYVDVDGKIDLYLSESEVRGGSEIDRSDDATELLKSMMEHFQRFGRAIEHVGSYEGSAGPSHVLCNGIFFERTSIAR